MVSNKIKQITEQVADKVTDTKLAKDIKDKSQQIWLAGLGAFSKAQEEGNKVFENLVKEGEDLQARTRKMADETVQEVAGRVNTLAGTVSNRANAQWDKLESVFEERVARALSRLGVPTNKDLQQLNKRIEQLSKAVNELTAKKADKSGS